MKRTLFSCCILLTALGFSLLSSPHLRANTCCEIAESSPDGVGHCQAPYTYADTYGECFWEDDDCDRVADESECGDVAELESAVVQDDIEPYDETKTDYWYDGESDSYYYYEFSDDQPIVDEIADEAVESLPDPLDELFDICETATVDAPIQPEQVVAAEEAVAEEANSYGYDSYSYSYDEYDDSSYDEYDDYSYDEYDDYSYDEYDDYSYDHDGGYDYETCPEGDTDYCDESSVQEVCQEEVSESVESVVEESVETVVDVDGSDAWQDEQYDYYSEYEEYGYDFEEYEYHYGEEDDYAYEPSDTVDWDTVVEPAGEEPVVVEESISDAPVETIVEDAWEGEYDSDYEDYYSEYDYGYDAYSYDDEYDAHEYDYEYWDETEAEVEVTEADLPTVVEEPVAEEPVVETKRELPRAAVLSLAQTLSRIGSTLQSISEHITEMVDEEVAQQPTSETIER